MQFANTAGINERLLRMLDKRDNNSRLDTRPERRQDPLPYLRLGTPRFWNPIGKRLRGPGRKDNVGIGWWHIGYCAKRVEVFPL